MELKITWKAPVRAYCFGWKYEIRDCEERVVVQANVLKGDLTYRKNLETLMYTLASLMNGWSWVEKYNEGIRLLSFGGEVLSDVRPVEVKANVQEETKGKEEAGVLKTIAEEVLEQAEPEEEDEEEGEARIGGDKAHLNNQKKKRGRPRR